MGTGRKKYQLFLRLEAQQQQSSNVITQLEMDGNLVNKNSYILKEILFIKKLYASECKNSVTEYFNDITTKDWAIPPFSHFVGRYYLFNL